MNTLDYYQQNYEKIFSCIDKPYWKVFKVVDEDGTVYQSRMGISNARRFLKFIQLCKNPQKLYVSVSSFLNPSRNHGFFVNQKVICKDGHYFYPREGYLVDDCILLDTKFFIDLDCEEDLRIAQDDGRKIIDYITNHKIWSTELEFYYVQYSGGKGVHVIFDFKQLPQIYNPEERIRVIQSFKKAIIHDMMQNLCLKTIDQTHCKIMEDIFRVFAIPYSVKGNGNIVTPLFLNDFMTKDIFTLISKNSITRAETKSKAIEAKADDHKVATVDRSNPSTQLYRDPERDSLSSDPLSFRFMDNMVTGLKNNYVTVLRKKKSRFKIDDLTRIQRRYNLSDFFIYLVGEDVYAINTKLVQFKRLTKIMRAYKSINRSFFITRRHTYIPLSSETMPIISLGVLKSEYALDADHSYSHSKEFNLIYNNLRGQANNKGIMVVS